MMRPNWTFPREARYLTCLRGQVVRERDFRLVAEYVVDLSLGGARVGPCDPVLTGERILLSFCGTAGDWIDAEAVVARVIHGRRRGERVRLLGLQFEAMDLGSEQALVRLLESRVLAPSALRAERRARPRCAA